MNAIRKFTLLTLILTSSVCVNGQEPAESNLSTELKKIANEAAKRFPAEMFAVMKKATDEVRGTGIEKSAKQVGDRALDAELIGWDGKTKRLSELWSDGPIVLMWYRGGWCPYCNAQLRAMQKDLDKLGDLGAKLVVLTPELPEKAKQTAESNDLNIVALHDQNNALAKKYGIVFQLPEAIVPLYRDRLKLAEYNGTEAMELPLSATYVIDSTGVIRYAFLDADYTKRAEPSEIINALKKIEKQ